MSSDAAHLVDRLELRALVENYARGADRRDGELVAAQFVPTGRILIFDEGERSPEPGRRLEGTDAIAKAMQKLSRYESTTHFLGQQMVDITGDRATGETYCLAHHISGERPNQINHIMSIRYLDDYVRINGQWRIEQRRLMCDWVEDRRLQLE